MRLIHNPTSVTCPLCSKPFKTELYLKRHLVGFHEQSDRQRQEDIYHQQATVSTSSSVKGGTTTKMPAPPASNSSASTSPSSSSDNVAKIVLGQAHNNDVVVHDDGSMTATSGPAALAATPSPAEAQPAAQPKLRFQGQASSAGATGDGSYGVELGQLASDAKPSTGFAGGMLQFNATFH